MALGIKEKNIIKYYVKKIFLPWATLIVVAKYSNKILSGSSFWTSSVSYLGACVLIYNAFKYGSYWYDKLTRIPKNPASYGKWAVVTGATSGIGEAFSHELAQKYGMSILLVSRNEEKLKKTKGDIETKTNGNVEVDYVQLDLGNMEESQVHALKERFKEINADGGLGLLVNCAGVVNDLPTIIHEEDDNLIDQIVTVNTASTLKIIKYALPHMVERKSGGVITVSSGSCTHPSPMISTYSSTKCFQWQLSRSLYYEYKEHGIDFLCIYPYLFVSGMFRAKKASYLAPFPETIISACMPLLGYEPDGYPYWFHAVLGYIPKLTYEDIGYTFLAMNKRNRARALSRTKKSS